MSVEVGTEPLGQPRPTQTPPLVAWQHRVPLALAGAALLVLLLLYASTFGSIVAIWKRDSTFAHGFVIPVLVAWLLWRLRSELQRVVFRPAPVALALLVLTAAAWIVGELIGAQFVTQYAAVAMIPLVLWCILGSEFVRLAAFPLFYLLLAVPVGDALVPPLMKFTANFTVFALQLSGVPVWREGLFFSIPGGDFEVVKACSGIRYLIASISLGLLFAYFTYRSHWRQLAFVCLCVLIPVLANGLRAYGIVMLAHLSDMRLATDVDHLVYGWLFFGVVMFVTFWIGTLFRDRPPGLHSVHHSLSGAMPGGPLAMLAAAVLALLTVAAAPPALAAIRIAANDPAALPRELLPLADAHWSGPVPVAAGWRPRYAGADVSASGAYVGASGAVVQVNVELYWAQQTSGHELAMSSNDIADGTVWTQRWKLDRDVTRDPERTQRIVETGIRARDGGRVVWHWYLVNGRPAASQLSVKLLEAMSWLAGRAPHSALVAISTGEGSSPDEARARLTQFTQDMASRLEQCLDPRAGVCAQ